MLVEETPNSEHCIFIDPSQFCLMHLSCSIIELHIVIVSNL